MNSIRRQMGVGIAWMVSARLAERSLGLVSTLILVRLLEPADFGLVAMAMVVVAILEVVGKFGFDMALIQRAEVGKQHYDTAWTFNLLYGLVSALLLFVFAHPVSSFYDEPRLVGVLELMALIAVVKSVENIGIVDFRRNLQFNKEFRLLFSQKLVGFVVTVVAAYALRSYWALLLGVLATSGARVILSFGMHPYRPRPSLAGFVDLFSFSKWLLLNNLLLFLNNKGVDMIVGKLAGARELGLYTVSYELSNTPTTELVFPVMRALFPGYSRLTGNVEEFRDTFLFFFAAIALASIPAGCGIALLAEPIVTVLLGPGWEVAVPLIAILGIFGAIRAVGSNTGAVWLALGMPKMIAYLTVGNILVVIPLLFAWVPDQGAQGAARALLVAIMIVTPVNLYLLARAMSLSPLRLFLTLLRPLLGAGIMTVGLLGLDLLAGIASELVRLLSLVGLGALIYTTAVVLLWIVAGRPAGAESTILRQALRLFPRSSWCTER